MHQGNLQYLKKVTEDLQVLPGIQATGGAEGSSIGAAKGGRHAEANPVSSGC